MDANEKELKSILVESTPILFLGQVFLLTVRMIWESYQRVMDYVKIFLIFL